MTFSLVYPVCFYDVYVNLKMVDNMFLSHLFASHSVSVHLTNCITATSTEHSKTNIDHMKIGGRYVMTHSTTAAKTTNGKKKNDENRFHWIQMMTILVFVFLVVAVLFVVVVHLSPFSTHPVRTTFDVFLVFLSQNVWFIYNRNGIFQNQMVSINK